PTTLPAFSSLSLHDALPIFFAFAHLAIDAGGRAFLCKRLVNQDSIDPQAAVFLKRKHPVIPPGKNAGLLRMQSQRIAQTDFTKLDRKSTRRTPVTSLSRMPS